MLVYAIRLFVITYIKIFDISNWGATGWTTSSNFEKSSSNFDNVRMVSSQKINPKSKTG